MTDEKPPWKRQPGEPNELFRRFQRYLTLPGKRSLLAAYNNERSEKARKHATSCPNGWWKAFHEWRWQERAAAWDDYNQKLELEQWQEKRKQQRDREWQISQAWLDKAEEMRRFPLATVTTDNGKTVVEPARWSFRDSIAIVVESCNLARRAAGMSNLTEAEALQVLVDLGVLPPEVVQVGTDALRQATQNILDAIARGSAGDNQT